LINEWGISSFQVRGRARRSEDVWSALGVRTTAQGTAVESLPFAPGDATAGTENELQAVVIGNRHSVDLPLAIESSKYYSNVIRRLAVGEASRQVVGDLQRYLNENLENVWENSWVRFPACRLDRFALGTFRSDLRGKRTGASLRSDAERFTFESQGETWIRVPVSYVVRLALADVIGRLTVLSAETNRTAFRLMNHFTNDNTSPETFSFHVVPSCLEFGSAVAREMKRRFLLTHLLVEWANTNFGLEEAGQRALVYFAPHPPQRQKQLNDSISDSFYRELFMSPCLSGWGDSEAKRDYMHLAHQVISRSQLNAVSKLREAAIVTNDLMVLPNTSSVSLANNGTHLSLGSRRLTACLRSGDPTFTNQDEKRVGDLVIKISEHFLPLFVNNYSAAPYRLPFSDFHPERVLGFLPHELDYTHLRMLWRHWQRKAHLRIFGRVVTPYGPRWLDEGIARLFQLRGDLIPDFRLVDFPVAWLATGECSALDGADGNDERLKADLESMGVTDRKLKLYLPMSLRVYAQMGFSGFEARQFSLFHGFVNDFAPAVELQQLVTLLAFKYIVNGTFTHAHIPDDPSSESERRQPLFYSAIGLKAFNIHSNTRNAFLRRVLTLLQRRRGSRHRDYLRVYTLDYCLALIKLLKQDAADLIELLNVRSIISDLEQRLSDKSQQAGGKLVNGILNELGKNDALKIEAREWNYAAERYYRGTLRRAQLKESLDCLRDTVVRSSRLSLCWRQSRLNNNGQEAHQYLETIEPKFLTGSLSPHELNCLMFILLESIVEERRDADTKLMAKEFCGRKQTPVHRQAHTSGLY
jgi:hypothetical protein